MPASLGPSRAEYVNTGLHGTPVGTTDTSVCRFAAAGSPTGNGLSVADSAANGTVLTVDAPGMYEVNASISSSGAATVAAGISKNASGSALTGDPTISEASMLDAETQVTVAGESAIMKLSRTHYFEAGDEIRLHATDGSGGSPAALDDARIRLAVTRVTD